MIIDEGFSIAMECDTEGCGNSAILGANSEGEARELVYQSGWRLAEDIGDESVYCPICSKRMGIIDGSNT